MQGSSQRQTPPEWDLLLSAAQKNKADRIRQLVQSQGVPPGHSNAVGQTALHIAALWGHIEAVQALVDLGAPVAVQNGLTGATPLHMVAQSNKGQVPARLQIVDCLIAAGASVAQPDKYGRLPADAVAEDDPGRLVLVARMQPEMPPLFDALKKGNVDKVRELLMEQPELVTSEHRGRRPIHAVVDGMVEAFESDDSEETQVIEVISSKSDLLMALLASPKMLETLEIPSPMTAGGIVEAGVPLHKLTCLLRHVYKTQSNIDSETTVVDRLKSCVEALLQAGATIPTETSLLLHQAARRNEVMFAQFLIETLKLDPNAAGRQGMTPLQFAARSGQLPVLEYLLQQPTIQVHAKDERGQTALDAAMVNDRQDVVKRLQTFIAERPAPE